MADPLNPFSYAEQFNPRNRQQPLPSEAAPVDPVIAEIRRQRDADLKLDIALSPSPDTVARTTRVAREAGVPTAMIEDKLDDAERAQNAQRLTGMMNRYPAIGKWAYGNPRGAVTAQDDHESLGILGSAWDGLKKINSRLFGAGGANLIGGVVDTWNTIDELRETALTPVYAGMSAVAQASGLSILDPQRSLALDQRLRQQSSAYWKAKADAARAGAKGSNFVTEGLLQGLETVPLTGVALLTGDPKLAAATIGITQGGQSYQEARQAGKDIPDALRYGIVQGAVETGTELAPESALLKSLADRLPIGKVFGRYLAEELPGEATATFLQSLSTWQTLHPEMSYREWAATLPADEAQTVLGVISGSAFQVAAARAGQKASDVTSKVVQRISDARQAKDEAQAIDRIGKAAEGSKLRARDPDAYAEVVRHTAEDAGVTHVFIPGEAAQAYMQSDSYDQYSDPLRHYTNEINEAAASGGDFVLPADVALGALPGTPAWGALKDDMRLTAGGMSAREATTFDEAMADVVAELSDQIDKAEADSKASRTAVEKLTADVQQKLQDAGFTPSVSRQQAELIAQRAVTRAQRLGQDITGNEFDQTQVRQVLPPALAAARKADATDLVINALRKGGDAMQQDGQSLLEFIAKRGGVNDTGGDIASMGGDKWHRGKVGRRKLIRPFDAQAALGGISGAGDYGIDNTLRAAIDAGYFPELAHVENEQGASTLDTQALLDAIGEELAGSPRYAQAPKVDPMRAAADELRSLLSERGLDPKDMTDAELRAEIAKLDEEVGGGYEQPAYHGSPHIFDKFSLDAIGTGEGAQAFGWGLYFAGRKEIAQYYRDALTRNARPEVRWQGKTFSDYNNEWSDGETALTDQQWTILEALDALTWTQDVDAAIARIRDGARMAKEKERAEAAVRWIEDHRSEFTFSNEGRLYHVDIPEDNEFLLWDEPISEQSPKVKEALKSFGLDEKGKPDVSEIKDPLVRPIIRKALELNDGSADRLAFIIDNEYELYQKADRLARRAGLSDEDIENYGGTGFYIEHLAQDFLDRLRAYQTDNVGQAIYRNLSAEKGGDKEASLALHEAGIAGIKYLDGGSRTDGDGTYNYVVFDDSRVSIQAYEQSFGEGPRGRIVFPEGGFGTGPSIIELFKDRNLSTLTHELGHQWLEELRYDAHLPDAPAQLKADWLTVQAWFKANGHPIEGGVIPVEAHELWARGIERYMMEGKAPSTGLKRLFETFRSWMIAIYKTVDRLRAPISPEVREVMDRLIATDEEIAQAHDEQVLGPLFKDAAEVGMSGPEFEAYTRQVEDARGEANSKLLEKTMNAIRRRETEQWRERKAKVQDEITASVDQRPIYRALTAMKAAPISHEWLTERMGQDVLSLLPKRVPPIHRDGGAHPDAIAEQAGFASGEEMINALIGAEQAHRQAKEGGDQRSMRERTIQTEVEAAMAQRYGDPLNDGSIEREALAAVHNELQGEVMASEIRVLARKTGKRATPYAIARAWARQRVRQGVYAEEGSPGAIQRHARSVARAGREAEKAMMAGNAEDAFRFKQQQMLNSALLAEAKEANDEIGEAVRRMNRIARAQTMRSVDQEYLEQAHALLEAVDLRERTQKSIARQGKWEEWAAAREAEGYDVVVPASFEATLGKVHWTRQTVENLLGLDEAVKQVVHLGRLKQTLLDNQEQREWDAIFQEAVDGAGGLSQKPPRDLMEPGWGDRFKAGVASWDAGLLKMETVFDWLDGGNSNGVFNRVAFRPVADAQARENDMLGDYYGRIRALFEGVPAATLKRWAEATTLPFTNRETGLPERLSRQQLIAVALNTGNAGNLQRLTDGYGWNAGALQEYLASELTADEWQFVQGVWDTIDTLWPEIEAMERRINGVAPDKVEATEIVTPHGTFRGGYYPAVYDSTRDLATEERRGRDTDLFESIYTRATTRASATKARTEKVSRPILLDLGVINRHLGEVIHDITHREAVMQAHRFLTNHRVAAAVDAALGIEIRKGFRPWVKFVANSWAMERAGNEGIGKFFGKLRANATAVGMGFRLSTALTQVAGYSNSTEVIGERWMAEGIARASAHPVASFNFVMERSGEVRHRMDTLDRDIRTAINQTPLGKLGEVKRFMYHGIGYMDRVVVVPTWLGAYNKALSEGMSEDDAIYAADKAVRLSQGAGSPKDLAAIQRGTGKWGELLKAFTMFYSYFSAFYQRERTLGRDVMGRDTRRPRNVPKLISRAWWLLVVPAVLPDLIKMTLGNGGPDDDEWWAGWAFKKFLSNSLGPLPGVRDLIEPSWDKFAGNKSFGYSLSPLQRIGESIVNAWGDAGKIARGEDTKHATRDVLETTGYVTGLVPGQIAAATQFLVDVGQGDANPRDFADWIQGLSTGRIKH